jgi:hypothetical protein
MMPTCDILILNNRGPAVECRGFRRIDAARPEHVSGGKGCAPA